MAVEATQKTRAVVARTSVVPAANSAIANAIKAANTLLVFHPFIRQFPNFCHWLAQAFWQVKYHRASD